MNDRWRCFVGLPIERRLRVELQATIRQRRAWVAPQVVRWTDPRSWHVTLAFLGDVDRRAIEAISARWRKLVDGYPAPRLLPASLVCWPEAERTRMVWCCFARDALLIALHQRVAATLGVAERRRYRPHVTLAKMRGDQPARIVAPDDGGPGSAAAPQRAVLYRSHFAPDGATYEPLASMVLEEAA